jgi:hypothetical protein
MEAKARSQWLLLAGLVLVLAAALWWNFGAADTEQSPPATASGRPRATPPASRGRRAAAPAGSVVEPVALAALEAPVPEPVMAGRNPFRFQPKAPPPAPPNPSPGDGPDGAPPAIVREPGGPPPPPPIPLRFIGTLDQAAQHLKLAVLSDGRNVFYGREGDIIEGRYRIVRIGVESIEMMHVDGRGQQTIRLSGS